jgi:beta-lactamase regulating signal transducer with metallopeptidase domain/thiol-disulfide isomerase/thioredoxin
METLNAAQFLSALGRTSMQAGVLVLVVLLAQWFFRQRLTPRWRCALWLLVVVRLMLPLSLTSSASIFNWLPDWNGRTTPATPSPGVNLAPAPASLETSFGGLVDQPVVTKEIPPAQPVVGVEIAKATVPPVSVGTNSKPPAAGQVSWTAIAVVIWFVGVVALLTHVLVSSVRLARRFAHLPPMTDPAVLAVLADCRKLLGVRARLVVVENGEVSSPALQGLIRPQLLLPIKFAGNFSPRELRHIFLHELAHVKRRDLWLNWLVALLQVVHWFNPLVWIAFARWRADRELACDALALEAAGAEQNREYGRTMLRLLENFTPRVAVPGMVGILEDRRQLRQRIQMIAQFRPASRWSALALVLMAAIAAGCLTDAKKNEANSRKAVVTDGNALPRVIDLTSFNQTKFGAAGGFKDFPVRPTIDGLPFQVGVGGMELFGKMNADRGNVKPMSISGIKIGVAFDELHLLHDVSWEETPGRTVAIIRLHYTDGSSHDFEIKYGVQVTDWNRLPSEETEVLTDGASKIVWRGPGIYKGTARLFKTVLQNPHPDREVETMDLISTGTRASYMLVAATVARRDPQRAVTPGLPLNQPARHFDGALKVSVVDMETGAPIAGADVFPYTDVYEQGIYIAPQLTSSKGETVIKYPVDGTETLGFTVTKPGYRERSGNWQRGNIPQTITYRLTRSRATATSDEISAVNSKSSRDAEPLMLDLSLFYRERFITDGQTNADVVTIAGRRVIDGVPFQIDGRGVLYGQKQAAKENATIANFPDFLGIPVGRKFDELHLIHATFWPDVEGQVIALIRLHYADGATCELPIVYGGQVRDWQRERTEEREYLTDANSKIIWRGPGIPEFLSTQRMFKSALVNPYPRKLVASMDVVSTRHLAAYDLMAATVVNHDPNRALTPSFPADEPERHFDGTLTLRVVDEATGHPIQGALVDTYMDVDGTQMIAVPLYTSAAGEAIVRYPTGRETNITVAVKMSGYVSKHARWSLDFPDTATFRLARAKKISSIELSSENVKSGETKPVQIVANDRTVIGHLERNAGLGGDADLSQCMLSLQPDVEPPQVPKEMNTQEKVQKWYQDWMQTNAGRQYVQAINKRRQLQVKADGTFRAEAVVPGKYKLFGNLWQSGAMLAQIESVDVVVPEGATNAPVAPFDIGPVALKAMKHLSIGDVAPDFDVNTLDGHPLKLSDFHGKYVLLDFWATWCGPCVAETPNLKATCDAYGKDERFVMISLSLDPDASAPKKFAQDKGTAWLQGFLGDWSKDNVTKDYGVYAIPSILLIGPDGKVIAQGLRDARIKEVVGSALTAR